MLKGLKSWRTLAEVVIAAITLVLTLAGCALQPDVADTLHDLVDGLSVQEVVPETSGS